MPEYKELTPPSYIFKNKNYKYKVLVDLTEREEYPETGGSFRYYVGKKYPLKGCPYKEAINDISKVKGVIRMGLEILKDNKWLLFLIILVSQSILNRFANYSDRMLKNLYLEEKRYCISGRELRRVLEKYFGQGKLIEFIILVWEYDIPYRFRGQDILGSINKENLLKDPTLEVYNLITLMISREIPQESYMTRAWATLRTLIYWTMKLKKSVRVKIMSVLMDIDINKIRLDMGDLQFAVFDLNYNFKQ